MYGVAGPDVAGVRPPDAKEVPVGLAGRGVWNEPAPWRV